MKTLDLPPAFSRDSTVRHDAAQSSSLPPQDKGVTHISRRILRFGLLTALSLTVVAVFIPLNPSMPVRGTDMSWMMALNQAVAQHLVFGKDIVFTFGPYASIYTELYHPTTDRLMMWGSLFLGLSYFALLLLLGKVQKSHGTLLYGLFLAAFLNSRDALLISYPLMVALAAYRMSLPDSREMKLNLAKPLVGGFAFLFAPLGLMPLIKGSFLPFCGATVALCCGLFWHCRKKALAVLVTGVPAASCLLLWVVAGQPVSAVPKFLSSTHQFISGYTEAMATEGDPLEWFAYILASLLILLVLVRTARGPKSSRWFLAISYALFLFTAFKGGFVRHDKWHDVAAGSSILAAALLLIFVLGLKRSLLPIAMAALVWAYTNHDSVKAVANDISLNLRLNFEGAFLGARIRLTDDRLKKIYEEHMAAIHDEFPIAPMSGTTDIYSYNQSWLLASQNTWAPRPVMQSYSAYTLELAELNRRYLESKSAPDNILLRIEPINARFPSLEDGLSWPILMNRYVSQKLDGQALYLHKRATTLNPHSTMEPDLFGATREFGEEVALPESNDPLFARMEFTPTLLGRIFSALFKPPQLYITVKLPNGNARTYRALSNIMNADFLITPLVNSTEEFALLAAGGDKYLPANQVKSITMSSDDRKGWFWKPSYSLKLRKIELQKNTDLENRSLFDQMSDTQPANLAPPATLKCEGSLETINGGPPSPGVTTVGGALSVDGWMGIAIRDGIVPDSVIVSLTSESGKTLYVKAHSTERSDLRQHFSQPGMPDPGYAALVDVSSLKGRYTLGLARTYNGNLGICQQFKLALLINP